MFFQIKFLYLVLYIEMDKAIFTFDICRQEINETHDIVMTDNEWKHLQKQVKENIGDYIHQQMYYIVEERDSDDE